MITMMPSPEMRQFCRLAEKTAECAPEAVDCEEIFSRTPVRRPTIVTTPIARRIRLSSSPAVNTATSILNTVTLICLSSESP